MLRLLDHLPNQPVSLAAGHGSSVASSGRLIVQATKEWRYGGGALEDEARSTQHDCQAMGEASFSC